MVYAESEAAVAALKANGRDILGANCTVSLASSMPTLKDGSLASENVSDSPAVGGEGEGAINCS